MDRWTNEQMDGWTDGVMSLGWVEEIQWLRLSLETRFLVFQLGVTIIREWQSGTVHIRRGGGVLTEIRKLSLSAETRQLHLKEEMKQESAVFNFQSSVSLYCNSDFEVQLYYSYINPLEPIQIHVWSCCFNSKTVTLISIHKSFISSDSAETQLSSSNSC